MLKTEYMRCRASLEREIVMAEFNILTCVFCEAKVGELDLYNVVFSPSHWIWPLASEMTEVLWKGASHIW